MLIFGIGPRDPNFGPPSPTLTTLAKAQSPIMSSMESNAYEGGKGSGPRMKVPAVVVIGSIVTVIVIVVLLCAFPGGGDHRTPHAPVNPAMAGAPSESDHTNTDADDQVGGFGKGDLQGKVQDDNMQRTQGSPMPVPKADSTATK